jgi:N-acetylglucosamine repressor
MTIARLSRHGRQRNPNERKVLRLIRDRGPLPRAEVIRQLGLSAPTVLKAVASLLESGLLEEDVVAETGVGRPAKKLRLAREATQVLGIVIAPGTSWVCSSGLDGQLSEERALKVQTPGAYDELIDALADSATALMGRPAPATLGAGICVPGLIDLQKNQPILSANLHWIEGRAPARDLAERLGIGCVTLPANHALCLAERYFGDARGLDHFVALDFGEGVGMGLVSRGRLIRGKNGFAGEIGHITVEPDGLPCGCGNRGCLETVASDNVVAARVSRRLGRRLDIDEVVGLARADPRAFEEDVRQVVRPISIGLAAVINLFNPSTLFLHGRLFDLSDDLIHRLLEETGRRALGPSFAECRVVRARGDKRQGAVAAVLHHLIEFPASELRPVHHPNAK